MGRRVRTTAGSPVHRRRRPAGEEILTLKPAGDLDANDWLPLALGGPSGFAPELAPVMGVIDAGAVEVERVLVRPERREIDALRAVDHRRGAARLHDIKRAGTLRLSEALRRGHGPRRARRSGPSATARGIRRASRSTSTSGASSASTSPRAHCTRRDALRIQLVVPPGARGSISSTEVVAYWQRHGVQGRAFTDRPTAQRGHGRLAHRRRVVDAACSASAGRATRSASRTSPGSRPIERKRALLSGLWEGDGSWSLVNGGPSVILEWGTISDELAEGVARLLADVGLVCAWRRGRTRQVDEGDALAARQRRRPGRARDVPRARARPRRASRQRSRARRSGSRRPATAGSTAAPPWVRVVDVRREPYAGPVYSLEVPGSHTVVANRRNFGASTASPRM